MLFSWKIPVSKLLLIFKNLWNTSILKASQIPLVCTPYIPHCYHFNERTLLYSSEFICMSVSLTALQATWVQGWILFSFMSLVCTAQYLAHEKLSSIEHPLYARLCIKLFTLPPEFPQQFNEVSLSFFRKQVNWDLEVHIPRIFQLVSGVSWIPLPTLTSCTSGEM